MAVITVARQFGAGGSSVARIVADRLGADVVDKALIDEVARRLKIEPGEVEAEDEHGLSLADRLVRSFDPLAFAMGTGAEASGTGALFDSHRAVRELTEEVIREVAGRGNVVIVGRAAAVLLRDLPGALHVFLCAAEPVRMRTVMARFGLDEPTARQRLRDTDAARAAYVRQTYSVDWRDPLLYDLVINTGRLGYEVAADLILACAASLPEAPASADQQPATGTGAE